MRPKIAVGAAAAAVTLTATGVGVAVARRDDREPKPRGMLYRHEQTADGVNVTVRNPSKEWTLRGQRVMITMFAEGGAPIRSYGPTGKWHRSISDPLGDLRPNDTIDCCLLPDLAPGAQYVFRLWSVKHTVHRVTIDPMDSKPVWEHTAA